MPSLRKVEALATEMGSRFDDFSMPSELESEQNGRCVPDGQHERRSCRAGNARARFAGQPRRRMLAINEMKGNSLLSELRGWELLPVSSSHWRGLTEYLEPMMEQAGLQRDMYLRRWLDAIRNAETLPQRTR